MYGTFSMATLTAYAAAFAAAFAAYAAAFADAFAAAFTAFAAAFALLSRCADSRAETSSSFSVVELLAEELLRGSSSKILPRRAGFRSRRTFSRTSYRLNR